MILSAYVQAAKPDVIQVWVGLFGTVDPPPVNFRMNGMQAIPLEVPVIAAIHDQETDAAGKPLNHRGIFRFAVPQADTLYRIDIEAGSERYELLTRSLPDAIPPKLDGSFNLLLCSCYYQPEDKDGLLGTIVAQIKIQPHLIVMAGDQVYLDLPSFEDLPETDPEISQRLGKKYRRNWLSTTLNIPGLEPVLARAPVVCIPDDHEFWNNYPFSQRQLPNTWSAEGRDLWAAAAKALYEDYQGCLDAAGVLRIDIQPLKMLFVDMRCGRDRNRDRDESFHYLARSDDTLAAITRWVDDLTAAKADHQPAIGVLSSGQALFVDQPNESDGRNIDAEMSNYAEMDKVHEQLDRLADAGIPVLYLTGDVHWGRVATARDLQSDRTLMYEIISSPARLFRTPLLDSAHEALNSLKSMFGNSDTWPRHSKPLKTPDRFGRNRRFALKSEFEQAGDHVAVVSFTQAGAGVEFQVSYYAIHKDKSIAQSRTTGNYRLLSI
ncbi:alkaline phosphatase D family protein [Nitrosomonas sp.]|uniref:alkaline phosphatase D family protein n=1 Tax=Nitrosomonas sp. TaxID=42353 RepID=UPI0026296090|nr:alkaline phosphatase D family protein [Nitrosomonas sp.]